MPPDNPYAQIQDRFIQIMEDMFHFRGLEPFLGRLYGLILLSPTPLTQEDLVAATHYSRSQISRLLKSLEDTTLIRKHSSPGSRTKRYEADPQQFLNMYRLRILETGRLIQHNIDTLTSLTDHWTRLPPPQRTSDTGTHLHEVFHIFQSHFQAYLKAIENLAQELEHQIKRLNATSPP